MHRAGKYNNNPTEPDGNDWDKHVSKITVLIFWIFIDYIQRACLPADGDFYGSENWFVAGH